MLTSLNRSPVMELGGAGAGDGGPMSDGDSTVRFNALCVMVTWDPRGQSDRHTRLKTFLSQNCGNDAY